MQSSLALRSGESTLHTHRGSNKCSLTVRGIQRRACRHHTPLAPQAAAGFPTSSPPEPDKAGSSSSSSSTAAAAVPQSLAHLWPKVSWSRYHLQVLFVDQTDTVRGRLAAGLFERCAEWNGYGRALYPWSAGLAPGGPRDIHAISKLTALMRGATSLEILPRYFTRPPEAFELEDLDRYDLVLALDRSGTPSGARDACAICPSVHRSLSHLLRPPDGSGGSGGRRTSSRSTAMSPRRTARHYHAPATRRSACSSYQGGNWILGGGGLVTNSRRGHYGRARAYVIVLSGRDLGRVIPSLSAARRLSCRRCHSHARDTSSLPPYAHASTFAYRSVHEALHGSIAAEYPPGPDRDYYMQKVCLLTTFSHYESDAVLTRRGGFALLPAQLSYLLKDGAGGLAASKAVVDIPSPDLSSPDGAAQWEAVVAALILSTASLVKYLVDAYPEDMPHYDPQD
ncbi:hypothetical protein CHLRE_14g611484v5 [Chlamydomonas reinhardtii]|uniref:Uncharacterized protein n=1 Tax=Chlamydomonas reinhardtii TaxID=3055 RepID=A0A2K3CX97_CHLRE|nr:uncharacterized protein CHLRE_14g611484v5 [Chlamydomonas reinhardtii]PNW72915.1 hypothetical protein CHLRE_14g611484v5 [Chlamydomonas reinhardtii]